MVNFLGVSQALDCVERLRSTVRDVTTREEKLEREFATRTAALRKRRDTAMDIARKELETQLSASDQIRSEKRQAAQLRFDHRTTRIQAAFQASQKQAVRRAEEEEGRRKYRLQTEGMQAKRDRESGMSRTEKRFQAFGKQMESEDKKLTQLEADSYEVMRGFSSFRKLLSDSTLVEDPETTIDEDALAAELKGLMSDSSKQVRSFRWKFIPFVFRVTPLWIVLLLCPFLVVPAAHPLGIPWFTWSHAIQVSVGGLLLGLVLYLLGRSVHARQAHSLASRVVKSRRWHTAAVERSISRHTRDLGEIESAFLARSIDIEQRWGDAASAGLGFRDLFLQRVQDKGNRAASTHEEALRQTQHRIDQAHQERRNALSKAADDQSEAARLQSAEVEGRLSAERESQLNALREELQTKLPAVYEHVGLAQTESTSHFPKWEAAIGKDWTLPQQTHQTSRLGQMDIDVAALAGGLPKEPRLALPGPSRFDLPLFLSFPDQASLVLETSASGRDQAVATLNNVLLRILSNTQPGRIALTVVDPIGLGQNFAGVMHLADHAEHMIQGRIWTQPEQIERRLADLNEHMEKVIQMYLRNEYATIADYNRQAGTIAEKYHLLVVADFPTGFTDSAARRLLSIATSGARCGVFTMIHWDDRQPLSADFPSDDLRKSSVCISWRGTEPQFRGTSFVGAPLRLDLPPSADFAIQLIHKVGKANRDSNRVEVPFEHIAPKEEEMWSLDTTEELRVPIGRTGATKLQYLSLGKGTRQHALMAGKTGSGKSTLFHAIITNLCLWCSPEAVEFYLIDFKKGVEFKCYATHRTPHVKVVAIESDREFGLSVLQKLDEELRRRGDLFRGLGVQDLPGYKRSGARAPLPRCLLMIDEFQEFFVEDDKVSQGASLLLDRIVRQGRAFGIHVILGSQTLGGAYTVARATLGQMVVRIALQCNEADSYLIMDDTNAAPRLLTRPGEGIYNDAAGASEGNSPFQAVWISDETRDHALEQVRQRARRETTPYAEPFIYEGDAPADASTNLALQARLRADRLTPDGVGRLWLGAPNSIKGPTEVGFRPQSGKNLLIVGQREEAILAILSVGMISLAAQYPVGSLRLVILDGTSPGTPERDYLDKVAAAIPHDVLFSRDTDLAELMADLVAELKQTTESGQASQKTTFILVNGLQRYKKLRNEDEFSLSSDDAEGRGNPASNFNRLITEGPAAGFHVIVACDGYNNVNRFLNRKTLGEFEMRVLFQMSANDSASLIDSPKAGSLGLHRAVYYNDQEGSLEVFRPYALPPAGWIADVAKQLARTDGSSPTENG